MAIQRMLPHDVHFFGREPTGLVENLQRRHRLAHVVQQPAHCRFHRLRLRQAELARQPAHQAGHRHRMQIGVVVGGLEPRHADQGLRMSQHRVVNGFHQRQGRLGVDRAPQPHIAEHRLDRVAAVLENAACAQHLGFDADLRGDAVGAHATRFGSGLRRFGRGRRRSRLGARRRVRFGMRARVCGHFHIQPARGIDHQLFDAAVMDLVHIVGIDQERGLPERMVHPRAQQLVDIHAGAELI